MSHFSTFVIKPDNIDESPEEYLQRILEPYNENVEVEPYDRECYCIGMDAKIETTKKAEEQLESWDSYRQRYWKIPDGDRPSWEEFTKEMRELSDKLEKEHPMYRKPRADCEECHGTGIYKSTYNPKSKWDWYQVGGRWSGFLTEYDPESNPKNKQVCFLCGGTGMRTDDLGNKFRETNPEYKCNGCNGTGIQTKWPTQFAPYEGDILPILLVKDDKIPFAIVTPEGEWIEHGDMGWWGIVTDEKDADTWKSEARTILNKYMDENHSIIVVDCHI